MNVMIPEKRCVTCGIPLDAECFDVSGSVGMLLKNSFYTEAEDSLLHNPIPKQGEQKVLASFQLHPQYCGIITHFAQYTDLYASDNSLIHTPGFEWVIFQNGKPVFPYTDLNMIINPWGYNCLQTSIRLDENAKVEFVLKNRSVNDLTSYKIKQFAGRIVGRYWYNDIFGKRIR